MLIATLILGCGHAPGPRAPEGAPPPSVTDIVTTPAGPCGSGEDPFSEEALSADIEYLASDALEGRLPGTPGDEATLAFIEERFRCLGLTMPGSEATYRQPFVTSKNKSTANVIGLLPGTDPELSEEIVVVGGHHDHLGPGAQGKIRNGANDNASGTAAVLAIARHLREEGTVLRRTVAFVTFGFEENDGPCEGSTFLVANPPDAMPIDRVVYMLTLDMLGTYPSAEALTAYGSFKNTPARELLEARLEEHADLNVDLGKKPAKDDSDFQAFCDAGVPYLYFETWDLECYHAPCDDASAIDYPSLTEITRLSAEMAEDLTNTDLDLMSMHGDPATKCRERSPGCG